MSRKIVIVGGSIGGLFAGVLLHRAGFDVSVYERSAHGLEGRGAGLVAQHDVFTILRDVGFEHLARIGVVAHERVYLDRTGEIIQRQRTPQMQLSWDVLFRAFRDLLPPECYFGGAQVASVSRGEGGAAFHLSDGRVIAADLVIGADGLRSVVRAQVAGAGSVPRYVGYATWRGLVPETLLPPEAAQILFERFAFYDARGSHALGYLVPGSDGSIAKGQRRFNWVWYRHYDPEALSRLLIDRDGVPHDFSLPPGALPDAAGDGLRADADALLPPAFAAAVRAERRPFIQAIFDYATPRMVQDRIALLGDAAFVARPHTAMGVAKAAGDAMALRDSLVAEVDMDAALARYDRARQPFGADVVAYGQRLGAMME